MTELIDRANTQLKNLKVDQISKKNLADTDFKEIRFAVMQRCTNSETINYAISELESLLDKFKFDPENFENEKESMMKSITEQLEKLVKDESTYKSTLHTLKRMYNLSKQRNGPNNTQ